MTDDVDSAFDVHVVRMRMLSPTVRELVLLRADGASMDFAAGQCVSLSFRSPAGALDAPPEGSLLRALGPRDALTREPLAGSLHAVRGHRHGHRSAPQHNHRCCGTR